MPDSIPTPLLSAGPFTLAGAANAAPVLAHDPAYMVADGTIAFDFTADVVDGRRFLLSKDSSGFDDGGHIGVYIENGRLVARLQDTSETYVLQTGVLVGAGETHHLAVNFGTGGLELYLDGAQVGSLAYTGGLVGNAEPIVIGANQWASGDLVADILSDGFDGDISSVALYGSRLTPEQIGLLAAGDPDNNAPVAVDDTYVTNEDDVLSVTVGQGVLANDSDTDSDPLTSTVASGPEHGTVNLATDGSFVYTPDSNYSGSDSFTYRVADGRGGTAIATVNITIDPSNDAPEFSATQLTLVTSAEAGAIIGALGATDPDGDTLSYTIIDGNPDGVFSVDASGNLVLADPQTIDINVTPSYALNIAVSDGTEITTATITVQLSDQSIPIPLLSAGPFTLAGAANAAPVLAHDPAYMVADGTIAFDFTADVVDGRRFLLSKDSSGFDDGGHIGVYIENGRLVARLQDTSETYVLQTGVLVGAGETHHLAVNFGTGGLELYLDGAQVGSLAYTGGLVGNAEPIVIGANQWASGDLVADILSDGFDGDISSVALYGSRLTPEQIGLLAAGDPDNNAPVAVDDTYVTNEDDVLSVTVGQGVLANDSDTDSDPLTSTVASGPEHGTVNLATDGSFVYTPDSNYSGSDSFTYRVADGRGGTAIATVNITIDPSNDAPEFSATQLTLVTSAEAGAIIGALGATDPDGDTLSYTIIDGNPDGVFSVDASGNLVLADPQTIDINVTPSYALNIAVSDGTEITTATITVQLSDQSIPIPLLSAGPFTLAGAANAAPVLAHDPAYMVADGTIAFDFTADVVDGRRFLLSKDSSGFDDGGHIGVYIENGRLVARLQDTSETYVLQTGVLVGAGETHHLAVNFGTGGLELYLDGAQVGSLAYTGGLVGNAEPIVIGANQWASGDLVADILSDGFDGDISSVALYGSRLTPEQIGLLASSSVVYAPVAGDDGLTTDQDVPLLVDVAVDLLGNDSDANGDTLSLDSFTQPTNGTVVDNGDGTLSYTPNSGYNGVDSFTYTVSDGALTDTANVNVTVNSDTPPTTSGIVSDDFAGGALDPVWTYSGIDGFTRLAATAADGFLEIHSPQDVPVSASDNLTTPRLLQSVTDQDFQISAGFLTEPTQTYQEHGLLVIQDDENWIRFDLAYTPPGLVLIVGLIEGGSTSYPLFQGIGSGLVSDFRVTRSGELWTFEYSADGLNWTEAFSVEHTIAVSQVGVFAGSTSFTGNVPGYTAQVDYFENTADPIADEDGNILPPNNAPNAENDALMTDVDVALVIDVTADLLSNDSDPEGDAISLAAVTPPSNGALTDNGNGTYTYTPDAGFNGIDSFMYTITDGQETATATASITVGEVLPPTSDIVSDDFAGGVLDPIWNIEGPAGTSANLATNATDAFLELVTPDGSHDVWGTNNGARAMQDISDGDFQLETRFLSTPTDRYQLQGFLVEQDADNWIRFDTYSDGTTLRAFAAVTTNGSSSAKLSVAIPGGSAPYLQVTRAGDLWTMEYSTDGTTWVQAGSFTQSLIATSAGVFAGNTGPATGFTAQVDYFENTTDPIADEDGTIVPVNVAPVASDDGLITDQDVPLSVDVAVDLLGNDSDANGDTLSLDSFTQPTNGTVVDNGDGTLSYTPNSGYNGVDSFTYTVSDGALTDTANVNVTVNSDTPPPTSGIVSDDFAGGALDPVWNIEGPAGTSANLATNSTDGFLELVTPDGNHDAWGPNNSARAMQDISDGDFQLATRFLSTPTDMYQLQGFLVEQDAGNWIRFDTYSDGTTLRAFAAVTTNGSSSAKLSVAIPGGSAPYLQVTRAGDLWTMEYSTDGTTWVQAGSFTQSLIATSAGVFAGNTGPATGFTAQVDYFENTADPIADEDGTIVPVNVAPVASDDGLITDQDVPLSVDVAVDLLGNDSDANGDTLSLDSFTQPTNGTVVDNGDGTLSYTPNAGYNGVDSFTYTVSDGALTDTANVNVTVNSDTPPPTSGIVSDDFAGGALDPVWNIEGPAGTSANLATNSTDGFLELVTPDGNHDAWGPNNSARAMQSVTDEDFQLATRFLSTPTDMYQLQGFLVEQDAGNWIRFDTYSDGTTLRAFAAVTTNGSSSAKLSVAIPGGSAPYLQVTRAGDLWTMEYSTDGTTWVQAGSFTQSLIATSAGVFAGNTGPATGFTAQVDYFENTADPIADEDGTIVPVNVAPVASDDGLITDQDVPLSVDVAVDLLGNDSDANGDTLSLDSFTQPTNGTVVDNGDGTLSYTPNAGYNDVDSFTYTVTDGTLTDSATVNITVGNPINVWYGLEQTFGSLGEAQEWVNVLGNVAGDVTSLSYSLNGGLARSLSVGTDTRRLQNEGDFNIDVSYSELDGSSVDDVITITAQMSSGDVVTQDVVLHYQDGAIWDANYSIDWSTVTDIQNVAQIVDGTWNVVDGGLRPVDLGYDRVVAIGDQSWDNYELSMTVSTHDLLNIDPNGRDGGGFAIGMLWDGHTDTPIQNFQPKSGWEPGAAFFYTDDNADGIGKFKLHPSEDFFSALDTKTYSLDEGVTYELLVRVEQTGLYDRTYSMRIWEEGTAEPTEWTLQGTQTFAIEDAPATGSIYLNAHYFDVAFNNLSVTEITGSDIVQGTTGNDQLMAVDTGDLLPGKDEIDVFVGQEGADIFVFGDINGSYYDDGIGATLGETDYGFVWDFTPGADKIQLAGSTNDYLLAEDTANLPAGTSIWLAGTGDDEDELVGLLNAINGIDLGDDYFIFTDTLFA